ncbi:N-acetylneuraminate synthase family protein [Caldithrix abyssi]|nr:N-acetylneuraminate synthase family protein [Caldithrix abyssi]
MKVIILGAGGAGLAAGMKLTEKGFDVDIYESKSFPGGLAASENIDGMYFDYGPHIYHTHDEETNEYWQTHFGDLLEKKEFFSLNYKDGVYYEYPLSYEIINNFPEKLKNKVLQELDDRKPEHFKRATNFKECLIALVGPTLEEMFFDDYSRKLWGIPTDQMAASWAPKRIEIRKKNESFWYNQQSYAPIYGSGAIMDRMVEIIKSRGGNVHFNHELDSFEFNNEKILGAQFKHGEKIDINDTTVISTLPITVLAEKLGIETELNFTKYLLVYLVFSKNHIIPDNIQTIYYAHEYFYFHRVTEQKKYSNKGYPDDKTILCFEVSWNEKPFLDDLDEKELINRVLEQFCSTGIVDQSDFIKGFTRTLPHVNPVMKTGYEHALAHVRSQLSLFHNLHTVGSPAEFQYGDLQILFAKANDLVDLLTSKHYSINKNLKSNIPFNFNQEIEIYDYLIGGSNPPLIVAEIGLNHNGDIEMAKELILKAKQSGADIAKFQTYTIDSRVSQSAKGAKYADKTLSMEETTWEMFKRLQLSKEDHDVLFEYAKEVGIPIFSTPFDETSVDQLIELGVETFKVASFDLVNIPFLKYVASKKKPIILSTGMSSLALIEDALNAILSEGNNNVILLHCVSSYPASHIDANLKAIHTLKSAFNIPVGYSDHTVGNLIPNIAMALGAKVIEKHFTLDTALEGPDHVLSLDPEGMAQLSKDRNTIITALGTGIKKIMPSEYLQINRQRKSIFTSSKIKKGETISLDNIVIKGPGHGLLPKYFQVVLGKKVTRDIEADSPLTWDDVLES